MNAENGNVRSLHDTNIQLRNHSRATNHAENRQLTPTRIPRQQQHNKVKVRFIPSQGEPFTVLLHSMPSVNDSFLFNNIEHLVIKVQRSLFHPENSWVREGNVAVYTYISPEQTESTDEETDS